MWQWCVGESVSISGPVLLTAGSVGISSCCIKAVHEAGVPTRQLFKEGRGRQKNMLVLDYIRNVGGHLLLALWRNELQVISLDCVAGFLYPLLVVMRSDLLA